MLKVAKFGGTSVADSLQIEKIKSIVEADGDRRYIVMSASMKFPGRSANIFLFPASLQNSALPKTSLFRLLSLSSIAMRVPVSS